LKFLGRDFDHGVTPLFSFLAEKDGKNLESDLSCYYAPSTWYDKGVYLIHAECKSFNHFERKDIKRMEDLSAAFPGSTIIFSTLNSGLEHSETKMICSFAIRERRKRLHEKRYSNVVVLTGTELFSYQLDESWRKKGGVHENLSKLRFELDKLDVLADATQQIYLGLPSWHQWWSNARQKGPGKRAK
jgi:hypothetical protein